MDFFWNVKIIYFGILTIQSKEIKLKQKTWKKFETELTSHTKGGDEMNKNELENVLKKDSFDVLQN